MEDFRQRNSPDSSTNEDTPNMTNNNNHLSGAGATSEGGSKNLTIGYKCPKGCKALFIDETTFAGHLLSEHNVRLVVTSSQQQNQQQQLVQGSQKTTTTTTSSPLSSLSPASTPPGGSHTKCPVCRLQVDDLPFHFATAHSSSSSTNNKSPTNHDRSETTSTTNNNVVLNRRIVGGNLTNSGSREQQWESQTTSPQSSMVVIHNSEAIKSEVLSYEEMERGMEEEQTSLPQQQKPESPIKITNSASSRKNNPPARVMPIFLPNQPLPASQLAIEECSSMASQRGSIGGEHSPTLKNFERHVRNLPMTVIPTVLGNSRLGSQVASSITMNGQANSPEHDSGIHLNQIMA